jgi:hypothetical protein
MCYVHKNHNKPSLYNEHHPKLRGDAICAQHFQSDFGSEKGTNSSRLKATSLVAMCRVHNTDCV